MPTPAHEVFKKIVSAQLANKFIERESRSDKEFHFQNWVRDRIGETGLRFEQGGRNSYPDFRLVESTIGFEIKGLAYPGRELTFDSNSQVPMGRHNGRSIYYVFGRYPADPDETTYPVTDLVFCHGDFLNADSEYVHENKSVRGFGSYGDIMIRDRKMYVVPTPFALATNVAHFFTLIVPADEAPGRGFELIGDLVRREAEMLVVGYTFDLQTNVLDTARIPNPNAGREHRFSAWRSVGESGDRRVEIRQLPTAAIDRNETDAE